MAFRNVAMLLVALASPFAAAAPPSGSQLEALVREGLQDHLLDAESARIRGATVRSGTEAKTICGEVNAKNLYGAYTGFRAFIGVYISKDDWKPDAPDPKEMVVIVGVDSAGQSSVRGMCISEGLSMPPG